MNVNSLRFIVYIEGKNWVAQCLEYDICTQALTLEALRQRMMILIKHECKLGDAENPMPPSGVLPAPAQFHEMWATGTALKHRSGQWRTSNGAAAFRQYEMTPETIQQSVDDIRAMQRDPETAHVAEEDLHQAVLAAIAGGLVDDPAECARVALTTAEMTFPRW